MKNKVYSIILASLLLLSITTIGEAKAASEEVCKQQTHWYYFSLADHANKASIEASPISTKYATTFTTDDWPENAKIESVTTYKGFSKEDIAMWFDLYVGMKVPTYTDQNGEVHHVHDYLYHNLDENTSSTGNVDDATRLNYDAIKNQGDSAINEFRNNYINNVYNAQIIPSEAEVMITDITGNTVSAEIARTYGGSSLDTLTAYKYVVDPSNPNTTNEVYLISAKAKVVLSYDCEVPVEPTPEPTPEEPVSTPEPEQPLIEEPNPNTGDLGVILSGLSLVGASTTGVYAYRKRKNLI